MNVNSKELNNLSKYQTLVFLLNSKEMVNSSISTISKVCCDIKMDIKKEKDDLLEKDYGRLLSEVLCLGTHLGLDAEEAFFNYVNKVKRPEIVNI